MHHLAKQNYLNAPDILLKNNHSARSPKKKQPKNKQTKYINRIAYVVVLMSNQAGDLNFVLFV